MEKHLKELSVLEVSKTLFLSMRTRQKFPFNTTTFKMQMRKSTCMFLFFPNYAERESANTNATDLPLDKSMHLDRKSLSLDTTAVQRVKSQDIDLMSVKESESYFTCQILSMITLNSGAKDQLSDIPVMPKRSLFHKNSAILSQVV